MGSRKKRIKLDPDRVEKEPDQEEEAEEIDDTFEEALAQTREGSYLLEPENPFLEQERGEDQVEVGEDIEGIDTKLHQTGDTNLSLNTEEDAGSEFPRVKHKRNSATPMVRDFICTTCNYATNKPIDFTRHWLIHEKQSYTKENGVFICQMSDCYYVAPNKKDLLKHILSQHLDRYCCDFCYYVTYSEKDNDQHRATHYTYQCVTCNLQSTKLFFVQDHVEAPLKCKKCNFTSHHRFPYQKHTNWHQYPPESIVECGFCNFATGDKALLEKHKAFHTTKSVPCKMCRFTGANTAELSEHLETTHDTTLEAADKLHKCKFCTCKFIGLASKEMHEKLHLKKHFPLKCCSNSTQVQCPYCDHQETQRDNMNLHIGSNHAPALELESFRFENTSEDTVFNDDSVLQNLEACDAVDVDECKDNDDKPDTDQEANADDTAKCIDNIMSTGTDERNSTRHQTPESEVKLAEQEQVEPRRHTCPFCHYNASSEEDYDAHYKSHNTFKCNRCSLESTKRLFVEDHTEKPWGCPKCDFKAHHWLLMKTHSFSHHNEQGATLLKCRDCNFETKTPRNLKTHWLIHTRAVQRCKVCPFETRYEQTLRRHYFNRHNVTLLDDGSIPLVERPYECDLCACKFKEQVYLDKHKALHEKNGPFHLICRQCRQFKRTFQPDQDEDQNEEDKLESWRECPYCSEEIEARYRMIQHLSRNHPSDLEIEGYRFDDGEEKEMVTQTATTVGITMSNTALTNTAEDERKSESTKNTEKNEGKFIIHTEEDTTTRNDAGEGTSGPKQPGYILKHIFKEHGQQTFKCNICCYRMKGKYIIEKHMNQKHPPYITECQVSGDDVTKEKKFSCAVCSYTAKTTYFVRKHMLGNHVTEEEENDFYQIDKEMESKEKIHSNNPKEKRFSCAICPYTAKTRYFVRKHMLSNHATEKEGNDVHQIDKEKKESKEEVHSNNLKEETNINIQSNESIEESNINSIPIEQVVVKVEPTSFLGEQSIENQEETQVKQEPGLAIALVPRYREIDKRWCCPVCPYNVRREYFVVQHIEQKHIGCEKKTWSCTICPYRTKYKNSLRQHMERMHSAEQSSKVASEEIPCKQPGCDFKAPSVDELSTHMARHLQCSMQEVMVHKCELCNFGTVSKTIFRNHTKSCTGIPYWYQCYSCDFKSESRKGILSHIDMKHRYKYTHKKGYECLKCGYSSKEKAWKEYHHVNCHIKGEVEH